MITIKMIISDDNNDNHNTGQAFRNYISIELTYQVISSLNFQVPGTFMSDAFFGQLFRLDVVFKLFVIAQS